MSSALHRPDRDTAHVLDHHLGAFAQGLDVLLSDYGESSVLVTPEAVYRGLGEIRGFFQAFLDSADPAFWGAFKVRKRLVEGEVAYLVWEAPPWVPLATDTLHVRHGSIVVQTFTPLGG